MSLVFNKSMSAGFRSGNGLHVAVVILLVLLLSACASTGGNSGTITRTEKSACEPEGEAHLTCRRDGRIEISENHDVTPEVNREFDAAVDFLNQENYPEAIRALKSVIGKTDKFTAPYINLGIAYTRTGQLDKAEESFRRALDINSMHPAARNELGLVYRKTGRYEEARTLYQETLSAYPEFLPARKNLGVLCDIYMRDLECALEQYEEYLRHRPDDKKVKIWIADVKGRMD